MKIFTNFDCFNLFYYELPVGCPNVIHDFCVCEFKEGDLLYVLCGEEIRSFLILPRYLFQKMLMNCLARESLGKSLDVSFNIEL